MSKEILITGSQHNRTWELPFGFIPKSDKDFLDFVKDCPTKMLKDFGFGFWGPYNEQIENNKLKPVSEKINFPAINLDGSPSEDFVFDIGRGNSPIEVLPENMDIWLLPAEWYNFIPEGFLLIGLSGEEEKFKKGKTDDDRRFGCLAFGILRKSLTK